MADTIAVAALVRKRAELAGELIEKQREVTDILTRLGHIDGAILMLAPGYELETIQPKRPARKLPALSHPNELNRMTLDLLREAAGRPLPIAELMRAVMTRRGLDAGDAALAERVESMLKSTLRRRPDLIERVP